MLAFTAVNITNSTIVGVTSFSFDSQAMLQ